MLVRKCHSESAFPHRPLPQPPSNTTLLAQGDGLVPGIAVCSVQLCNRFALRNTHKPMFCRLLTAPTVHCAKVRLAYQSRYSPASLCVTTKNNLPKTTSACVKKSAPCPALTNTNADRLATSGTESLISCPLHVAIDTRIDATTNKADSQERPRLLA